MTPEARLANIQAALRRARLRDESHNRETIYFPRVYERDLMVALAESTEHAISRIVICASDLTDSGSFPYQVWRELAESGISIDTTYLLSHRGLLDGVLREVLERDVSSGIRVNVVTASALPDHLACRSLSDAIIVDGALLAQTANGTASPTGSTSWTITTAQDRIKDTDRILSDVRQLGHGPREVPSVLDLEEPLVQSAGVIAGVAPVLCTGAYVDKHGCDWYHGTWQFLRLMDLVSTPSWHHDFYRAELDSAIASGASAVLVSGTADYSVFAYVVDAFKRAGRSGYIRVVDLCHTPLFACQWYAKRLDVEFEPISEDVISYCSRNPDEFDLIVTDAFLTRFELDQIQPLLDAWEVALRPSGTVITTIRSHDESQSGVTAEEAIISFRDRSVVRWRRWENFVGVPRDEIATRAETYARRMVSHPLGSSSEIIESLATRFAIQTSELAAVPGELYPTKYLRIVLNGRTN